MAGVDPGDLVFLDETATPTTLVPLYGRAPRGRRAVGRVPRGRREHVSWPAALTPAEIGERVVVLGAVDRAACDAFVARALMPSLRRGQVAILDTLSVHTSAEAQRLVEAAGCRPVFLPTSSPDRNPIEHAFATCKQALRRAGARSFDAVVGAVGQAPAAVTEADVWAFDRAAGYPARPPTLPGTALTREIVVAWRFVSAPRTGWSQIGHKLKADSSGTIGITVVVLGRLPRGAHELVGRMADAVFISQKDE